MLNIEIIDVSLASPRPASLTGCHIDLPKRGTRQEGSTLTLLGWALGLDGPAIAVEVVAEDGRVLKRIPTESRGGLDKKKGESGGGRPDLAKAFPSVPHADKAGFQATLQLGTTTEIQLTLRAVLANQTRAPIGTLRLRRRWREDLALSAPNASAGSPPSIRTALVSVIIPCFNQGRFLDTAIESVLSQTYPHLEIIVVDDASSDNTQVVAERYPGVRYVRQPENGGVSAARNEGLRHCNGQFVVFLDSDDRLLPDALQVGLECFERHPEAAFVWGQHRLIDCEGQPLFTPTPQVVNGDVYLALLRSNFIGMHAAVMYRREAIEEVGPFKTDLHGCEDYELYLRIARDAPAACHEQIVAEYRKHGTNTTNNAELLLKTALSVLSLQRPYLHAKPERRAAYQSGMRFWRRTYGDAWAEQVGETLRTPGQRKVGLKQLISLFRCHPGGIISAVAGTINRRT